MKWFRAFFLAGSVMASGCSPDPAAPKKDGAEPPGMVRLAPVLRLPAAGSLAVPLSFSNGSSEPFTYVISYGEIDALDYTLYRDGKKVPGDLPTGGPIPNPVYTAKTLKPNESLTFSLKLNRHSKLKAGEYHLQVVYRVPKGSTFQVKYNMTPADFTLSYTLVVE